MEKNNLYIAEAYYTAVGEKNIKEIEKYLHPQIQLIGPVAKSTGKELFLEGVNKFMSLFKTLKIRTKCSSKDQVAVIYDLDCPEPFGKFSTASLMNFQDNLITKIELFFDARPFGK